MFRFPAFVSAVVFGSLLFHGDGAANEVCPVPEAVNVKKLTFPIRLTTAANETNTEGAALLLEDSGILLTAKHVAHGGKNGDKLFVKIGGKEHKFETLLDGPEGQDWALIKLVTKLDLETLEESPSNLRFRFELPQDLNYSEIGAKIELPRSNAPLNIGDSDFVTLSGGDYEGAKSSHIEQSYQCPRGLGVFVQLSEAYKKGDSGSPAFDNCNRLVGITSEFRYDPAMLGADVEKQRESLSAAVKTWDVSKNLLNEQQSTELVPSFGTAAENEAGALKDVEDKWAALGEILTQAKFVRIIPTPCILNHLTGVLDRVSGQTNADRRSFWLRLAGDRSDNNKAQTILRRRNYASWDVGLQNKINVNAVGPIDFVRFVVSSKQLMSLDAGDNEVLRSLQSVIARLYDDNKANRLKEAYTMFSRNFATELTYEQFVARKRTYFELAEKTRSTTKFLIDKFHESRQNQGNWEIPVRFRNNEAQKLIGSGQKLLNEVTTKMRGPAPDFPLDADSVKRIDEAIRALSTGAKDLPSPAEVKTQRYAATVLADLALAMQLRRRDTYVLDSIHRTEIENELEAARLSVLYDRKLPQPWDVASNAFEQVSMIDRAWYLASVAAYARCDGFCKLWHQSRHADSYAPNLIGRVNNFSNDIVEDATAEEPDQTGYYAPIAKLIAVSRADLHLVSGDSANDTVIKARKDMLVAAFDAVDLGFDPVKIACVPNCAPIGFFNAPIDQVSGRVYDLPEWLSAWSKE